MKFKWGLFSSQRRPKKGSIILIGLTGIKILTNNWWIYAGIGKNWYTMKWIEPLHLFSIGFDRPTKQDFGLMNEYRSRHIFYRLFMVLLGIEIHLLVERTIAIKNL